VEKFPKTHDQVASQLEHWFLSHYGKEKSAFNGKEAFTIFNHLYFEEQNDLIRRMNLNRHEIPVLVLRLQNNEFIVNTTERFIRITEGDAESLYYSEFEGHSGFRSIAAKNASAGIKTDGYFAEFGVTKKDGQVIYWTIPTGVPGFAFWNITKKCEIIGRRYLIQSKD
jgi:hypothetical protein